MCYGKTWMLYPEDFALFPEGSSLQSEMAGWGFMASPRGVDRGYRWDGMSYDF
jgi:hypothetical protein